MDLGAYGRLRCKDRAETFAWCRWHVHCVTERNSWRDGGEFLAVVPAPSRMHAPSRVGHLQGCRDLDCGSGDSPGLKEHVYGPANPKEQAVIEQLLVVVRTVEGPASSRGRTFCPSNPR
ncbi:hypothetical protein Zm00014a_024356 [Zea mays]|uniref:Uncharacterized protein n=1 Tax=Zea mays TaxID=4577 RepID=A0A3L6F9M7_MAIZE|nr:hypothetical protein Zm00014a_024356 [Zea mays]